MFLLGFFILITTSPAIIFQVILIKTLAPPLLLLATNQHIRQEITMRVIPKLTMSAASTSSGVSVTKAVHVKVTSP
ncbi:hypothetical protein PENTCL1PPCAC_1083, partial [Pristionchus entomophagus]